MEDETRNTRELLEPSYARPVIYVWRGLTREGSVWVDADPPEGGQSVCLGAIDMRREDSVHDRTDADVRYLEIRETAWGDYAGTTYRRSNARVIRQNYGEHVVTLTADFGFEVLLVRFGTDIPSGLFDEIAHLHDEGMILDEGDLSELESELESEDWESWGRSDWAGEIRDRAQRVDRDDDVTEVDDTTYIDALFWDVCADGAVGYWQAETATSGVWTDFERAADLAWAEIQRRRMASLGEWARELAAPNPGQLTLAL